MNPEMSIITLTFTQEELNDIANLVDAGVRATGLQSTKIAMMFVQKLESVKSSTPEIQPDV